MMNIRKINGKSMIVTGILVFALGIGATAALAQPGGGGRGGNGGSQPDRGKHGNIMGRGAGLDLDAEALVAEALGITTEELEAAHLEVRNTLIQQAVDEELITQAQADRLVSQEFFGGRDGVLRGFALRGIATQAMDVDTDALLADALGISVDDLTAARESAKDAAIQEAIDAGVITQEQVDEMTVFGGLGRGIGSRILGIDIDRTELTAQALGMSVEELQERIADGQSLSDVLADLELDAETVRDALDAAIAGVVQQAVDDGEITQTQADRILEARDNGFGFRLGGKGLRGGMRGGSDLDTETDNADSVTAPEQSSDL